ncbi:alpha/beta hydrolase [Sphingobacterium lactis]|uniref:alpha/beta hydrolase n=1 Tax=Sphingobacterium lactis TaxID=797291 RepID=UPI003F815B7B
MYQVQINILNNSDRYIGEPLYLAGTFNNWDPEHLHVGHIPAQGEWISYTLFGIPEGELDLKLSRGSFSTLRASKEGSLLDAASFEVTQDLIIDLEIDAWRDDFPASTASPQVQVLDKHFYFPELAVYRRVWVYLPKGYAESEAEYPVLYMHDGQHLFDEATSVGRAGPVEWRVDETIDKADLASIVVAIDHAQDYDRREQEYMIHPTAEIIDPRGQAYLEDIVNTLKPYVDKHYRTSKDPQLTAMVGSSLGGLMASYAGLLYPETFGTIASFSPSIWLDHEPLYALTDLQYTTRQDDYKNQEIYFYIGEKENRVTSPLQMFQDLKDYIQHITSIYPGKIEFHTHPSGKHSAHYWQYAFKEFYGYWQERHFSKQ